MIQIKVFVESTLNCSIALMIIEAPLPAKSLADEDGYWHDWAALFCLRSTSHALKNLGQKRVTCMKGLFCYTRCNGAEYLPWRAFVRLSATNWVLTALTCVSRSQAKAVRNECKDTAAKFTNDSDSENDFLTRIVVN